MPFAIRSSAFRPLADIPEQYTCEGADRAPPLDWRDAPKGTMSFALIVDDPDAPDPAAPKRVWVHWVLYNLPADTHALAEGASGTSLPDGAREGEHDGGGHGWSGPCPPIGTHRYFHKIYALDAMLPDLGARVSKADLLRAMEGHVLAQAELVGTYAAGRRERRD